MSLPPILSASFVSVPNAPLQALELGAPSTDVTETKYAYTNTSSQPKRRSEVNLIVGGPEDAKAIEEFDESPQWLVDDIMEHKRNNLVQGLKRMKRRIVVSEQKEEVPKYKYAEMTASNTPLGPEQFPDALVNLRAELSRGKTDINVAVNSIDLESPMDELVGRTPEVKAAIHDLQRKAEQLRKKRQRMLAVSSSAISLPPAMQRYLDRRNELMNSPKTESPLFRSSRTVPRTRRDVDRSFSPNRRIRSPSPDRSVDSDAKCVSRIVSNPEAPRIISSARSRSPPSRPSTAARKEGGRPGSPSAAAVLTIPRSAEATSRAEKEAAKKALAVLVLALSYVRLAQAAVQADIDLRRYNTASFVISRFMRRFIRSKKPGLGIIVPPPIRRILLKYRRKKAATRLKYFLTDCLKNQKGKAIRRFLYRIRKIQSLYWDKIELAYRKRLALEHQAAKKAQEEDEKRIKMRRTTQITADKWARKKEAVTSLLRKVDKLQDNREQLKKEESAAAGSRISSPSKTTKRDETVLYLGEFEGRVSEAKKMEIIRQTVKNKIRMSMEKEAMDQLAAAEASIKRLLNQDAARSALLEPESFKKLLQVQMLGAKKVQMKQKDGQGKVAANRSGNWDCFLLGTTLGPTMRKVVETSVLNDILEKRAKAERLQMEEQHGDGATGLPSRLGLRVSRSQALLLDETRKKTLSASAASSGRASPILLTAGVEVDEVKGKPTSAVMSAPGGVVAAVSSPLPNAVTPGVAALHQKRNGSAS